MPINEEWSQKALFLLWSTLLVAAMVLMAGLYCRIIYTLWFKRDPENQLTFQQRVSINIKNHGCSEHSRNVLI